MSWDTTSDSMTKNWKTWREEPGEATYHVGTGEEETPPRAARGRGRGAADRAHLLRQNTESHDPQKTSHLPVICCFLGYFSIVTLLLILVIFFLIRNLFKLVFERRRKVFGSHLKTRLTLAFVALTLVPTVVLFIASAGVLHTTIESWFTPRVEESLQSSEVVAQAYYRNTSEAVLRIRLPCCFSNN